MKIIYKSVKKKEFKLKVENLDDLWYLSQLVDDGDIILGKTLRKIKAGSGSPGSGRDERSATVTRKPVFLKLSIEKAEFHESSAALRISGAIIEGPDDVPKGSHHTFNIEEGTIFTLQKKQLLGYHHHLLEKATKPATLNILITVFDREEATFARLKPNGFEILGEIKGQVQKKDNPEKVKSSFYNYLIKQIKEYDERYNFIKIVIGSTSIWKDYLMKEIKDESLKKRIISATSNNTGSNGISEVLKRDEIRSVLKDERASQEIGFVEDLLEKISKDKEYSYGIDDVKKISEAGAVEVLLVTDNFIKKYRLKGDYAVLERIMIDVEKSQGQVHVISSAHEGGKKLDGIGGIGAILRYKLY